MCLVSTVCLWEPMRASVCSPLSHNLFNPEFQGPAGEVLCSGAIWVVAWLHHGWCWSILICASWLPSAETHFGTDRWTDTTQCHGQAQLWTKHAKNKTMVFCLVRIGTPVLLCHYPVLYYLTTCDQMRVCFPGALMAKMEKCGMTVWLSGFVTYAVAMPRVGYLMDPCQPKGRALVVCHGSILSPILVNFLK